MPQYQVEALRTIRSLQAAYAKGGRSAQAEQMRTIGDQVEAMVTALRATAADHAALLAVLSEARDFIMSGPARGDEVAIVNKISAALGDR
jgi:hypothetical protein